VLGYLEQRAVINIVIAPSILEHKVGRPLYSVIVYKLDVLYARYQSEQQFYGVTFQVESSTPVLCGMQVESNKDKETDAQSRPIQEVTKKTQKSIQINNKDEKGV
jgi:hypothetical protein